MNLRVDSAQLVLATYAFNHQAAVQQKSGKPPAPKTLMMHLNAACLFLEQATGLTIPLKETSGAKQPKLLPIFGDLMSMSQKWSEPKPKREAFTWKIFEALQEMVRELTDEDVTCFLDMVPAVFDWLCLGCFTGSRAGEYAQTVAKVGEYEGPHQRSSRQMAGLRSGLCHQRFQFPQ